MAFVLRRLSAALLSLGLLAGIAAPCVCAGDGSMPPAANHCARTGDARFDAACCCGADERAPAETGSLPGSPSMATLVASTWTGAVTMPYVFDTALRFVLARAGSPHGFTILRI